MQKSKFLISDFKQNLFRKNKFRASLSLNTGFSTKRTGEINRTLGST